MYNMNIVHKIVGPPHTEGARVRIGGRGEIFTVHAVEYIEAGNSRFDFYRLRNAAGEVLPRRYVRADLRTI